MTARDAFLDQMTKGELADLAVSLRGFLHAAVIERGGAMVFTKSDVETSVKKMQTEFGYLIFEEAEDMFILRAGDI